VPTGHSPIGRSSTACAVINGKLYVFSGEHVPRVPIDNHLNIFDFSSSEWQVLAPKSDDEVTTWPVARVGHFGTSCQGKFFIFGGRTAFNHLETLDDLWEFDPQTSRWTRIEVEPDSPKPYALSYHAMASTDNRIFVFGGCLSKGRSNELWEYSLSTRQWRRIDDDPAVPVSCRGGPGLACVNEQVHILFGFDGKNALGDHFIFDSAVNKWQQVVVDGACPPARSVTGVVALPNLGAQGSLFVFGGECAASTQGHEGAGKYLQDSWTYDLATRSWTAHADSASSPPSARGWLSTVALDDGKRAVVYGGFDGEQRIGDLWVVSTTKEAH